MVLKHRKKESKWFAIEKKKVRCYLCGKKILRNDMRTYHRETGHYSHSVCMQENATINSSGRRNAVKTMAVGMGVAGLVAVGADKFTNIFSQKNGIMNQDGQTATPMETIITSQGLILPSLTYDPANPVAGQMWYRSDAGVTAHFDSIKNRVVYSSEINNGMVNVSSKGVINGLSVLVNDGTGGFGPDSLQADGTLTTTSGTQEAVNYIYKNINTITAPDGSSYVDGFFPKIKFLDGVFNFTSGVIIPATGGIIFEGSGIKTTTLHDASTNGITLFSINQSVTQPSGIANYQFNMFSEFTISAGTKTVSLIDLTQTANNITSHNNIHNVFAFGQCSGPMLNWYGNSDSYIEDIQIEPGTAGDVMVQWYTDNPMIRGLRNSKVIGIIKVSGSIITVEDSTIGGIHIEESTIFSGMINTIGIKNTYINSSPNIPIIINLNSPTIGNLTFNNVFFTSTGTSPGQSIFGYGTNFEFLGGLSFIGCNFYPTSGTSLFQNNGSGGTFLSPPLVQFLSVENTFYTAHFGALSNVPFDISQGFANTNAVAWNRFTKKRNITTSTPAAPTATTSTSYVMCGFGISFTPSSSGTVKVKWITQGGTNTGIASMSVEALYGTGSAPTNGTAVTGTVIGSPMSVQSTTAGLIDQTMMFEGIINLTVNTTYWLDLAFLTANASDSAALSNTTVIIEEIE